MALNDTDAVGVLADHLTTAMALGMRLGEVDRATRHPDGERPESDTTHTVGLALMVLSIVVDVDDVPLRVDRLLAYAIVHDLVEAYAGDVCTARTLDPEARAAKDAAEAEALRRIEAEAPYLARLIRHYEAQADLESQTVHYLDKMCPKITHMMNGGAAVRELGMTLDEVRESHTAQGALLAQRHPQLGALRAIFDELCRRAETAIAEGFADAESGEGGA